MQYVPEQISTKFIGIARTEAGTKLNVFGTVSRQYVSMSPIAPNGRQYPKSIPVKLADLSPKIRRRLGC
jgi:hypothetical protein